MLPEFRKNCISGGYSPDIQFSGLWHFAGRCLTFRKFRYLLFQDYPCPLKHHDGAQIRVTYECQQLVRNIYGHYRFNNRSQRARMPERAHKHTYTLKGCHTRPTTARGALRNNTCQPPPSITGRTNSQFKQDAFERFGRLPHIVGF